MTEPISIPLFCANPIREESWLNEERFAWFKAGYNYASTQTRAIFALSQIKPEELYFAVSSIIRGATKAGYDLPVSKTDPHYTVHLAANNPPSEPPFELQEE